MNSFPENFTPSNIPNFSTMLYDRKLKYFRQCVLEHIFVSQAEKDKQLQELEQRKKDGKDSKTKPVKERYSDRRDGFNLKHGITAVSGIDLGPPEQSMIDIVKKDLENNGWKCIIGVANTFLFVVDPSNPLNNEPEGIESTILF